jgi:O-antigen ligase
MSINAGSAAGAKSPFQAPWSSYPASRLDPDGATAMPLLLIPAVVSAILLGGLVVFAELNALAACVSLLACLFVLRDYRLGVFFLIVLLPISASPLVPRSMGGITGLNPLNLLLLGTLLPCLLQVPRAALARMMPKSLVWLYLLPIVIAGLIGSRHINEIPILSSLEDTLRYESAGSYLRDVLFKPMLLVVFAFLVAAATAQERDDRRLHNATLIAVWAMGLMTVAFVAVSGVGLAQLAGDDAREFFAPLGMHANEMGRVYAVAYALMLFTFAETTDNRQRVILLITLGLVVAALMLTFSRTAFLGFALVNIWFVLSRRSLKPTVLALLALALLLLALPEAVWERMGSGSGNGINSISAGRVETIWLPLVPDLLNNAIIGRGLESILWSEALRNGSMMIVSHPHNAYLRALLDMGVIGLLLLGAYYFTVWQGFRQLGSDPRLSAPERGFYTGASVGLVSFLFAGTTGSNLTPCLEQVFLWLAIGMMYGRRQRHQLRGPVQ